MIPRRMIPQRMVPQTLCWSVHLISEKSIWKNQVRWTVFLVYFELNFYCTACVVCKKQLSNWFLQAKKPVRRTWVFQFDFSKFKYRSTRGMSTRSVQIAQLFCIKCLIFNQYSKQHLKERLSFWHWNVCALNTKQMPPWKTIVASGGARNSNDWHGHQLYEMYFVPCM